MLPTAIVLCITLYNTCIYSINTCAACTVISRLRYNMYVHVSEFSICVDMRVLLEFHVNLCRQCLLFWIPLSFSTHSYTSSDWINGLPGIYTYVYCMYIKTMCI